MKLSVCFPVAVKLVVIIQPLKFFGLVTCCYHLYDLFQMMNVTAPTF